MKDLGYLSQEISKGRNLDDNLEKYSKELALKYHTLGYIKLAMNYYTVYDIVNEDGVYDDNFKLLFKDFNMIIKDQILRIAVNDEYDLSKLSCVKKINDIREKIIDIMETVTSFVDRLRIYEYALNRIEYRFSDNDVDMEYYGKYLTNDIMHYILSEKDNVVINAKISEVVAQLPMRLTRGKFFEYLKDAFSLYKDSDKETIDGFVYTLKTSAMLNDISKLKKYYPECYDMYLTLDNADYDNIDETEYNRLRDVLTIATERMSSSADIFVLFAQMVNDAYTIILTYNNKSTDSEEIKNAYSILKETNESFMNSNTILDQSVLNRFEAFEGKQEHILFILSKCDYAVELAFSTYKDKLDSMNLFKDYEYLLKVSKLQSGSDFAAIDITNNAIGDRMDDSYAQDQCDDLIDMMTDSFNNNQQIIKRAIMSNVLSQLPVFFNTSKEIHNYINLSLQQCNDKSEQMAVIEIMKMLIN